MDGARTLRRARANDRHLRQMLSRAGAYSFGVVVQVAVQVAALPIVARLLAPSEYGVVATALVIMNLLSVVVDLGLSSAVARSAFPPVGTPASSRSLFTLAIITSLAVAAAVRLLGSLWTPLVGSVPTVALDIAIWASVAVAVRNAAVGYLRSVSRPRPVLALSVLSTAGAQVFALLGLAVAPQAGAVAYLTGFLVGLVVAAALGAIWVRPGSPLSPSAGLLRWTVRFAPPTVPHQAALVFLWFGDRLLIERLLSLAAVGRYQIAYSIGSLGLMVGMAVNHAWAPAIHEAAEQDRWALVQSTREVLQTLGACAAAATALGGPALLVVLAPTSYAPAELAPVVGLVALAVVPLMSHLAAANVITDTGHTRYLAAAALAAAAVNVTLNLVLVPLAGLTGAAAATFVTYLALSVMTTRAAGRLVRLPPSRRARFVAAWVLASMAVGAGAFLPLRGAWLAARLLLALAVALPLVAVGASNAGKSR